MIETNFPNSDSEPKGQLSVWQSILKFLKKVTQPILSCMRAFATKNPQLAQYMQLTCIYFFAIVDLLYSVLNNVFSLGYFPELLVPVYPIIEAILQSPILKIWGSPEKVFFLSYVVIEFMIVHPLFKFSKLVQYNVLLIFSLLMIQGLVISYWDLLFHRQIASPVANWIYDQGAIVHTDKPLAISFFLNTFFIFIGIYFYLYTKAMSGKFPQVKSMEWLTDSIAFWLKIKTPTMRFGARGPKKPKGKKK
jgi:hypothetical protein